MLLMTLAVVFDAQNNFKLTDQCVYQGCEMGVELAGLPVELSGLVFLLA